MHDLELEEVLLPPDLGEVEPHEEIRDEPVASARRELRELRLACLGEQRREQAVHLGDGVLPHLLRGVIQYPLDRVVLAAPPVTGQRLGGDGEPVLIDGASAAPLTNESRASRRRRAVIARHGLGELGGREPIVVIRQGVNPHRRRFVLVQPRLPALVVAVQPADRAVELRALVGLDCYREVALETLREAPGLAVLIDQAGGARGRAKDAIVRIAAHDPANSSASRRRCCATKCAKRSGPPHG